MIRGKIITGYNWTPLLRFSSASGGKTHEVILNFKDGFSLILTGPNLELRSLFLALMEVTESRQTTVVDWPQMMGVHVGQTEEVLLVLNSKPVVVRRKDDGKKVP